MYKLQSIQDKICKLQGILHKSRIGNVSEHDGEQCSKGTGAELELTEIMNKNATGNENDKNTYTDKDKDKHLSASDNVYDDEYLIEHITGRATNSRYKFDFNEQDIIDGHTFWSNHARHQLIQFAHV